MICSDLSNLLRELIVPAGVSDRRPRKLILGAFGCSPPLRIPLSFRSRMGAALCCIPNKVVITHSWDAIVNFHPR